MMAVSCTTILLLQACESYQLFRVCEWYAARTAEPFMMKEYEPEAHYQPLPTDWNSFFRKKSGGVEQDKGISSLSL